MKFTFKTEKPQGKWGWLYSKTHHIKLNKIEVGLIDDGSWIIRLMVLKDDINEDGNPNCKWKWVNLKRKNKSLDDAKSFLNNNVDAIKNKFNIYMGQ